MRAFTLNFTHWLYDVFWYFFWHSFWHLLWHCFWHISWHSFWFILWHSFWHFFWHSFWHISWHSVWHSFAHSFWHIFWHLPDILSDKTSDISPGILSDILSRGWGPAGHIGLRWSPLRSGREHWTWLLAVEVWQGRVRRRRRRRAGSD